MSQHLAEIGSSLGKITKTSQHFDENHVHFAKFWVWSAPRRRCGLPVFSPVHCFLPWRRFEEALFVVSRLDSKCTNARKSCRARNMLQNEYWLPKIGFDKAENEPSKMISKLYDLATMYCTVYIFKTRKKQNGPRVERGPPEVSQNSRVEKLDWSPKSFSFMISTRRRSIPENPRKERKNTHNAAKSAKSSCCSNCWLYSNSMILVRPDYFSQQHLGLEKRRTIQNRTKTAKRWGHCSGAVERAVHISDARVKTMKNLVAMLSYAWHLFPTL